ncbi:uncharacterized protein TRIVIDRAFT_227860 [Trichoderma virens Gv29-8]|uniref:Uncharacterized protein n=1 Tax=Hypocrea virens (strain Gv29-8 / FGSC 10586) TaxID=413071 RepID=G9NAR3_HYPVG|nr:uncharacterized protein TRIVIDRAFT_227860 [Trichoderma virens Gv29-8]EHK15924.1 hypothetical protein TRIVIDRAFT_227860 [Trichoderma virens Gv29-8]UKZ56304.1 hypothetical protein TrVGV298_010139 [Trichoderma virens]
MAVDHDRDPRRRPRPLGLAVRYADQVYNVLRLQAKMPYKPLENGFIKSIADTEDVVMQDNAADGSDHICSIRATQIDLVHSVAEAKLFDRSQPMHRNQLVRHLN